MMFDLNDMDNENYIDVVKLKNKNIFERIFVFFLLFKNKNLIYEFDYDINLIDDDVSFFY